MSTVDFVVVIVMILSILLAVLRGFTREVLTIVAWVGAIFAVIWGLPLIRPVVQGMFADATTADIAGGAFLGILTLVILSLISHQIGKAVKKSGLGPVDRSLGGVFGALRGAVLLCLIYILLESLLQPTLPSWLTEAKFQPWLASGAEKLKSILPPEMRDMLESKPEKPPTDTGVPTETPPEKPGDKAGEPERGYPSQERGDMERLIEKNEAGKTPPSEPETKPQP